MDAVLKYLRMGKMGRTAKELGDGLRQGGFETKSRFFNANVRTALKRQGEAYGIVKRGNQYWLAEWSHTPKETEADRHDSPEVDDIEEEINATSTKLG